MCHPRRKRKPAIKLPGLRLGRHRNRMRSNDNGVDSKHGLATTKLVNAWRSDLCGKRRAAKRLLPIDGSRGRSAFPCTPSLKPNPKFQSGSFYLAKNRNLLLGLDRRFDIGDSTWGAKVNVKSGGQQCPPTGAALVYHNCANNCRVC